MNDSVWDHGLVNAIPPSLNKHPPRQRGRFSPAGGLTAGGRLTLLVIVTGLILLAQAWQATHRYGQHVSNRPQSHESQTSSSKQ